MPSQARAQLVIISGLSGAGKTQALRCLEDMGFFCIDNLPPSLVPGLVDLLGKARDIDRVALVMDIRGGQFFQGLEEALAYLERQQVPFKILFLEADDEVLVRRFKETRRNHPLSRHGQILEGIAEERRKLSELRGKADIIIDTSEMTPRQLGERLREIFSSLRYPLVVNLVSFGYKYGLPLDADIVLDLRFLPNPFYIPELRPFTGHDQRVVDYIFSLEETRDFLEKLEELIFYLLPYYQREGRNYIVIALGCTGGQHRSVALANYLAGKIKGRGYEVLLKHRDLERRGLS
ncbi:MAG TPA: RNase adapter RapZ [Moorella mulderi]|nr:RNase adapter RapZ [Moorella mulderi]